MDDSDDEFDQIVTPDNELDKVLCVCVYIICLTYRVGHKDSQYRAPCYNIQLLHNSHLTRNSCYNSIYISALSMKVQLCCTTLCMVSRCCYVLDDR